MELIAKILFIAACFYLSTIIFTYRSLQEYKNSFLGTETDKSEDRLVERVDDLYLEEYDNPSEYSIKTNLFSLLDAYPSLDSLAGTSEYDKPYSGIVPEDDYCQRVDLYNLQNPKAMFQNKYFYTDYQPGYFAREKIMAKTGSLKIGNDTANKNRKLGKDQFSTEINVFHTDSVVFITRMKIGQNFLCATQMHNHFPGLGNLANKDAVVGRIHDYIQSYQDRPLCFNKSSLFPENYRLYEIEKEECKKFFEIVNSKTYENSLKTNPIQYLLKISGVHMAQGVSLLDSDTTIMMNKKYAYAEQCGTNQELRIAQTYISNPLLLDMNNKFDFRVYMLIASTNPLIVYYHDGFLKVSLYPYEKSSSDRATHLTNTFLAKKLMEEAKSNNKTINNMTEEEVSEYILWSFEKFQNYLLQTNKITDPNWLDNYLRPAFQRAMIHLVRMTADSYWKESNVYTMHGIDFVMDDNLNLWFIESNPSPLLHGTTKQHVYSDVLTSMFDIQFAYYRSRMARVLKVLGRLQKEMDKNAAIDLDKWNEEYRNAVKNRLEPQYRVSENNTYKLIMDENLSGTEAYFGLLSSECI